MQWVLLVITVYANGSMKYEPPTVFYSKRACVNAQTQLREMTPNNATVTLITNCVSRGGRGNNE